jgi:hypothetical protein
MSTRTRRLVWGVVIERCIRWPIVLALLTIVLANIGSDALAHRPPVNVSGYEIFLGTGCTIGGQPSACGVTFSGWIGGDGQVPDGWEAFPGDFEGLWQARINYTGQAGFGSTVVILGGRWSIFFLDGHSLSGPVIGGTVQWPFDEFADIGCGVGIGVVEVDLLIARGGAATFKGCLHDLPAGTVIPPMVWGVFF